MEIHGINLSAANTASLNTLSRIKWNLSSHAENAIQSKCVFNAIIDKYVIEDYI